MCLRGELFGDLGQDCESGVSETILLAHMGSGTVQRDN